MLKALLLVFDPPGTWDSIERARRGIPFLVTFYLLPMLALIGAAEGYGLYHWGRMQGEIPRLKHFTVGEAVIFETAQVMLSLIVVFVGARLVKWVGETFHGRHSFVSAFATVAYGLGPMFLLKFAAAYKPGDVLPWVTWVVGILISIGVLYTGIPRVMDPDPAHAIGLYFISSILLLLTSGLAQLVSFLYLQGRFPKVEALVTDAAARLPF